MPYDCVLKMMEALAPLGPTPEFVGRLFNTSNFDYYLLQVRNFQDGKCSFCPPDPAVNTIFDDVSNDTWLVWENTVAPRKGQDHQLVCAPRRHVLELTDLTVEEKLGMFDVIGKIKRKFSFTGYAVTIRSGDPAHHAGSIAHIHVNVHHADGSDKVEVTLGKSEADLNKKLPVLLVWEKMCLNLGAGKDKLTGLTDEEITLVKPKDKKA